MDLSQLADKITSRTRAIMVVHIYGLPVDMQAITTIAEKHGLKIIEDAAEAHGQNCHGKPCGGLPMYCRGDVHGAYDLQMPIFAAVAVRGINSRVPETLSSALQSIS